MKLIVKSSAIILSLFLQSAQADIKSDTMLIMNGAEKVFSQFFPSKAETKKFSPFLYRFYPRTGIYLGVNQENERVYVLGGGFGNVPLNVGRASEIKALLKSKLINTSSICDTKGISDVFSFEQNGSTTSISTNGQCPVLSKDKINACIPLAELGKNGIPLSTGFHTLSEVSINSIKINDFSFAPLGAFAEKVAEQKACFINTPQNLSENTIESDICLDVTKQIDDVPGTINKIGNVIPGVSSQVDVVLSGLSTNVRSLLPGLAAKLRVIFPGKINAQTKSTSTFVQVDDCFKTDATLVLDIQSRQVWKKENGNFVEVKK